MSFVDNDPVRTAGAGTEFLKTRKNSAKKARPIGQGKAQQIDAQRTFRLFENLKNLFQVSGRTTGTTETNDGLGMVVIAFWINQTNLIVRFKEALENGPNHGGLSALRWAGNEHAEPNAGSEVSRRPVGPEGLRSGRGGFDMVKVVLQKRSMSSSTPCPSGSEMTISERSFKDWNRIGDGDSALGNVEQRVIVFSVTYGCGIVFGKAESEERARSPVPLLTPEGAP